MGNVSVPRMIEGIRYAKFEIPKMRVLSFMSMGKSVGLCVSVSPKGIEKFLEEKLILLRTLIFSYSSWTRGTVVAA